MILIIELTSWPLDNKTYTAAALGAAYAARSRGLLRADSFAARTNGDNTLTISKGLGCLHVGEFWATFPFLERDTLLQFEDADGIYPRWDAVVLGYDKNANTAGLYVRTGLASQSPALPAMRRNADYDEIFLYRVTRPVGATKIEANHVVDLRQDAAYCGLMRDTIDALDTSVMAAAFRAFLAQIETELDQLHAGTATMLKATYDPRGKQTDIFAAAEAAAPRLYGALFTVGGWEQTAEGSGVYTQTAPITPQNGGGDVGADNCMIGPVMCEQTDNAETNETLLDTLDVLNSGNISLGINAVTARVFELPASDIEVVLLIGVKGGGA